MEFLDSCARFVVVCVCVRMWWRVTWYAQYARHQMCVENESILHKKWLAIPRTHSSKSKIFRGRFDDAADIRHSLTTFANIFWKLCALFLPSFGVQSFLWYVRIRFTCTHIWSKKKAKKKQKKNIREKKNAKIAASLGPASLFPFVDFLDTRRTHFHSAHVSILCSYTTNEVIFRMRDFEYYLYWVNKFINLQYI